MPYATLNGIRVHYEVEGSGEPLLLVSGLSAPGANWLFQVRDLAAHHQVITVDNRGVGETDLPEGPAYPIAQMADDAAALLRHLGIARAHVVGASMGGTIAMELALRHPRRVRSLALACTWGRGDGRFIHTIRSWMALAPRVSLEERLRHVIFPWVYTPVFLADAARVEDALRRALAYPFPTRPEAIERQGQGLIAWNGTRVEALARIKAPSLVLVGRDDILTPPAFSRDLATLIPGARYRAIAGGHGFFVEEAARFNAAIRSFLRSV